jgi:hypothetical protein
MLIFRFSTWRVTPATASRRLDDKGLVVAASQADTRKMTAATTYGAHYDLAIGVSDAGLRVELMLVAQQVSGGAALVVIILLIVLLIWAFS